MPKVSVVIPNYNHVHFLRQRIESVLQQSFQDIEVILLDDYSTDGSQAIISSYASDPRVHLAFNAANSGSTFKQWNKGVGLARGEYVWMAESDDFADERMLERLVAVMEEESEAAFVFCRSWRVSAHNEMDGFADSYLSKLYAKRWMADYCADGLDECTKYFIFDSVVPNASAVVFRKTNYEQAGGADGSLRLFGDWKLWAGLALTGKVGYVSTPLNYFRFHDQSVRGRDLWKETAANESLLVVRWLLNQITITSAERSRVCQELSDRWIPPVITAHVPLDRRLAILQNALAIDPRALQRVARALQQKLSRSPRHDRRVVRKV